MEVRPADRGRSDTNDYVARIFDPRIGNVIASNIAFTVPNKSSHSSEETPLPANLDVVFFRGGFLTAIRANGRLQRAALHPDLPEAWRAG
jgi:hypothetical protein